MAGLQVQHRHAVDVMPHNAVAVQLSLWLLLCLLLRRLLLLTVRLAAIKCCGFIPAALQNITTGAIAVTRARTAAANVCIISLLLLLLGLWQCCCCCIWQ